MLFYFYYLLLGKFQTQTGIENNTIDIYVPTTQI